MAFKVATQCPQVAGFGYLVANLASLMGESLNVHESRAALLKEKVVPKLKNGFFFFLKLKNGMYRHELKLEFITCFRSSLFFMVRMIIF